MNQTARNERLGRPTYLQPTQPQPSKQSVDHLVKLFEVVCSLRQYKASPDQGLFSLRRITRSPCQVLRERNLSALDSPESHTNHLLPPLTRTIDPWRRPQPYDIGCSTAKRDPRLVKTDPDNSTGQTTCPGLSSNVTVAITQDCINIVIPTGLKLPFSTHFQTLETPKPTSATPPGSPGTLKSTRPPRRRDHSLYKTPPASAELSEHSGNIACSQGSTRSPSTRSNSLGCLVPDSIVPHPESRQLFADGSVYSAHEGKHFNHRCPRDKAPEISFQPQAYHLKEDWKSQRSTRATKAHSPQSFKRPEGEGFTLIQPEIRNFSIMNPNMERVTLETLEEQQERPPASPVPGHRAGGTPGTEHHESAAIGPDILIPSTMLASPNAATSSLPPEATHRVASDATDFRLDVIPEMPQSNNLPSNGILPDPTIDPALPPSSRDPLTPPRVQKRSVVYRRARLVLLRRPVLVLILGRDLADTTLPLLRAAGKPDARSIPSMGL